MQRGIKNLTRDLTALGVSAPLVAHVESTLTRYESDPTYWLGVAIDLRPKVLDETLYHATELVYLEAMSRFPLTKALSGNYGVLLLYWGRLNEATSWLQRSLEIDPGYFHALHHMGYCSELNGEFHDAERYYRRALEQRPGSALTWNGLANVLWEREQRDEAMSAYRRSISLDPFCTDALFNLSVRCLSLGKFEEASAVCKRLLTLAPSDQQAAILRDLAARRAPPPRTIRTAQSPLGVALRHRMIPDVGSWPTEELWQYVVRLADSGPNPVEQWPPRVFLSHRRGRGEHLSWIEGLAEQLSVRGYQVVFDRKYQLVDEPIGIPMVVSEIARCSYFVPILTEQYRRSVEFMQGGELVARCATPIEISVVMDEWLAAFSVASRNRLRILPIWRDGPVLPRPLLPSMVVDVRDGQDYSTLLDRFPSTGYAGSIVSFEWPESQAKVARYVTKSGSVSFTADTLEIQWSRDQLDLARAAIVQRVKKPNSLIRMIHKSSAFVRKRWIKSVF